jgi:hypothetical protein
LAKLTDEFMIRLFAVFFLVFVAVGYSLPHEIISLNSGYGNNLNGGSYPDTSKANRELANQAMEHFINGSIDEVKGDT